jgi:hypothetical protein
MPPDNISRSAAKNKAACAVHCIFDNFTPNPSNSFRDRLIGELYEALDSLPAAEADVMDREPDNPAEIIRQIIAHCDADSLPDFVSDLNPKDERRIRDARSWIVTVGQLRAFLKAIERPPSAPAAEGADAIKELATLLDDRLLAEASIARSKCGDTVVTNDHWFQLGRHGGIMWARSQVWELAKPDNDISNSGHAAQLRGEG